MENIIKLYKIGSNVNFGDKEAVISAIEIRADDYIRYEVVWWYDGERHVEWVEEFEISLDKTRHEISLEQLSLISQYGFEETEEVFGFASGRNHESKQTNVGIVE